MSKLSYWLIIPVLAFSVMVGAEGERGDKTTTNNQAAVTAEAVFDAAIIQERRAVRANVERTQVRKGRMSRMPGKRLQRRYSLPEFSFRKDASKAIHTSRASIPKLTGFPTTQATGPITVLVNGVASDTVAQGGDIVFTIDFSDGSSEADISLWLDMDADKTLDETIDFIVEEFMHIIDNDFEDEDPAVDIYQITLSGPEDGGMPSNLHILALAEDAGGSATAHVFIEPEGTAFSVSGTITPATANVIVGAFPSGEEGGPDDEPWMTMTSASGDYTIDLPAANTVEVFAFDEFGILGGLVPDTSYHEVVVTGHHTGYDFNFMAPTSFVEGTVINQDNFPVPGILVRSGDEGPGGWDTTDASGNYSIGVLPGRTRVGIDWSVLPDYMLPHGKEIFVEDGAIALVNFTLYEADATIMGTVTLDGDPAPSVEIGANGRPVGSAAGAGEGNPEGGTEAPPNDNGFYTSTYTDADGVYTLHVSTHVDQYGYNLWLEDQPEGTTYYDQLWDIPANASGVDIHLVTGAGGLTGAVTIAGSTPPDTLYEVEIVAKDTTKNGGEFWASPDWETGTYTLYLPAGVYKVGAWDHHQEFFPYESSVPVVVTTVLQSYNIELARVVHDAAIEGTVTDCESGYSLAGAEVGIYSPALNYGDWTVTDSVGAYHFEVPAGTYELWANMEGYWGYWNESVNAPAGAPTSHDFCLERFMHEPPQILSVVDRPSDQGGWVYLTFSPGGTDEGSFSGWSIWSVPGEMYTPEQMVFLNYVGFHGLETYTALVPTSVDSNTVTGPADEYWSHFIVTGHHPWDPYSFFDSKATAGYSVDNIAPGVPGGMQIVTITGGVELSWPESEDNDFAYFAVYRATTSGGYSATPYATVVENRVQDSNMALETVYYYVVTAVDANGNASAFSAERNSTQLSIVDGIGVPDRFALKANYPNPFNPSTNIEYQLPEAGRVSLVVYDLTGNVVSTLVNDNQPAGFYKAVWNGRNSGGIPVATGVYFYRLTAGADFVETQKMVLMK
ncbi:MAG: carboxypeptidase regulatory-like domain-containing protein [Candidatus Neomarinimicrobiota bacterium]